MKKIYFMLLAVLTMAVTVTSCSDNDPFATATSNDNPHILDPVFANRVNGELPVISEFNRDGSFSMTVTVTPAEFTTVTWNFDGQESHTGTAIDTTLLAGTYDVKVIATTVEGKSTFREGLVKVKPLDNDPYTSTVGVERIVASGGNATLFGGKLTNVKSLIIGGVTIDAQPAADGNSLNYTVPTTLADGSYRVTMVTSDGKMYGADKIAINKQTMVVDAAIRSSAKAPVTINGINMENIASITINGNTINEFVAQTATSVTFTCPDLEAGDYVMTAKTKAGDDVMFYVDKAFVATGKLTVTSEKTLWEGHSYVSWELPDGDPNKIFQSTVSSMFENVKVGAHVRVYYSLKSSDSYHQIQLMTPSWTILSVGTKKDIAADGVWEFVLNDNDRNLIMNQGALAIGGHGFYVDRVTVE
ncbi:hypothetical protein [Prevotella sp.]|uniref:hypothetical protein n=1 Tax=Prevotella sp. TaxID=59823 RepID=UPI0026478875|nr:hypothetical protein [Prevotella sp.]MDN5553080.1 hypothetical protein [Prevotella sp.]